jgi:glyoxylase-like metal-dependent hydrolase (beta-lactamase superfamily II)
MNCGAYTLYAIEDGWIMRHPAEVFPDVDPDQWSPDDLIDGMLRVTWGCFLLTDGSRTVLVDTGMGPLAASLPGDRQAVAGQLPQALAMIGVRPDDVQVVVHTHLHVDHCGGNLTPNGSPLFPNAEFRVHRTELDFWLHESTVPAAPAVQGVMQPLIDAGQVEPVDGETDVAPGVRLVETPGHTPGHVSVVVTSQGTRTFIAGDVSHHPNQIPHPDWVSVFDLDPAQALRTRERVFEQVTGTGTVFAAGHYPPPGIGYIEMDDRKRIFVPGTAVQVA